MVTKIIRIALADIERTKRYGKRAAIGLLLIVLVFVGFGGCGAQPEPVADPGPSVARQEPGARPTSPTLPAGDEGLSPGASVESVIEHVINTWHRAPLYSQDKEGLAKWSAQFYRHLGPELQERVTHMGAPPMVLTDKGGAPATVREAQATPVGDAFIVQATLSNGALATLTVAPGRGQDWVVTHFGVTK